MALGYGTVGYDSLVGMESLLCSGKLLTEAVVQVGYDFGCKSFLDEVTKDAAHQLF